jgi:hypothetical protein
MGELAQRTKWARVDFDASAGRAAFALLEGPAGGLTQNQAVQLVTWLAGLRDRIAAPGFAQIATWNAAGQSMGLREAFGTAGVQAVLADVKARHLSALYVAGDKPFFQPHAPDGPLHDNPRLGIKYATALDNIMVRIGKAEQGGEVPATVQLGQWQIAALVAVVVTGAALAVIGTVAAWRYLDPDFRRDALIVHDAAQLYSARLDVFERTGQMPEPSELETQAGPTVERLASERSKTGWIVGAAVGGGVLAGTVILGLVSGRAA